MKKLLSFILLVFAIVNSSFDIKAQDDVFITEFTDSTLFNFVGTAKLFNKKIRLTEPTSAQRGGIWLREKRNVSKDFTIQIEFQITSLGNTGADGLAFVIQNTDSNIIGGTGGGIGYAEIPNSLAIEFDTYYNGEFEDPDDNHIGIQTRGTARNSSDHAKTLGVTSKIKDMEDGNVHKMRIEYKNQIMKVYLDDTLTPKLTTKIRLDSLLNLDNGTAWLGFTSSTGGSWAAHEIVSFGHRNVSKIVTTGLTPSGTICPNQVATLTGFSSDTTTITAWKWILPNETKMGREVQYSNSVEGEYPLMLIIERKAGFSFDTLYAVVKVVNPVRVIVKDTSICAFEQVAIKAQSNVLHAPYTFEWKPLNGGGALGSLSTDSLQTTVLSPGLYHYEIYVADVFGCDARDTLSVLVRPELEPTIPNQVQVCTNENYTAGITMKGGTPPYTYAWKIDGLADTTQANVLLLQKMVKSSTISCLITDSAGCTKSIEQNIIVDGPELQFKNRIGICPCVPTTIGGFATKGTPGYTYKWKAIDGISPLELSDSTSAETICTTSRTRKYEVEVIDKEGCKTTRDVTIAIDNTKHDVAIAIPSVSAHPLEKNAVIPIIINNVPESVLCFANAVRFDISYDAWVFDPNPRLSKGTITNNAVSGRTRKLSIEIDTLAEIHSGDTLTMLKGAAIMGDPGSTEVAFSNAEWNCSQIISGNTSGSFIVDSLCRFSDGSVRLLDFSGFPFIQSIQPHPANGHFSVHAVRYHGEELTIDLYDARGSLIDKKVLSQQSNTSGLPELLSIYYADQFAPGLYRLILTSQFGIDTEQCVILH